MNDRNTRAEELSVELALTRLGPIFRPANRWPLPPLAPLSLIFLAGSSDEATGSGGPASGGLSGATVERLRKVLARHLSHPGVADPELAQVLRQIVTEARNRQIRAEQLIVILKHVWDELPDARYAIDREAQDQVRQRLITLCIKAYYGG